MKKLFILAALLSVFAIPMHLSAATQTEKIAGSWENFSESVKDEVESEFSKVLDPQVKRWEISRINLPGEANIPDDFDNFRIVPVGSPRGKRISFAIEFLNKDSLIKRLNGTATLKAYADIVVAQSHISAGTLISPDMLSLEEKAVSLPIGDFCTELAEVEGQVAERRIAAGYAVKKSSIKSSPDVKAGEMVLLIAESQKVKITMQGIAREDGAIGETISVLNTRSNKKIFGRVIGQSVIQVVF